jgi:hypothetical protein
MFAYQCCFCAAGIDKPRSEGVEISLVAMRKDPPGQALYAHIDCLERCFAPTLAPQTPFDALAFEPD